MRGIDTLASKQQITQQPPPRPPKNQGAKEKTNLFATIAGGGRKAWEESLRFLRGVRSEFNKVTWPTMKELRAHSMIVIFATALVSAYMWAVGFVLHWLFSFLHH
jgi:preprotein translocase SecE subunit